MPERIRFFSVVVCLFAVIILCPALLSAGERGPEQKEPHNYLQPGSWSVQFQIADDFNLSPFNNKVISLKYHLSEKSAIRVGLNLDLDSDSREGERTLTSQDSLVHDSTYEWESSSQTIQLNLIYMHYPNPEGRVKLFYGAGPLVLFTRATSEREDHDFNSSGYRSKESRWERLWGVGLIGIFGAEWFATDAISFHAEYRARVKYSRGKNETDKTRYYETGADTSSIESETDYWRFDASLVTFGISLYF